jgi:hypothetical protein
VPRNMSFGLTVDQVRERSQTVTRRKGWRFLEPGDLVNACVRRKPGKQIERLCQILVKRVTRERLWNITWSECILEGFPGMDPEEFVSMFCEHMGGPRDQFVTRIEFEYV